MKQNLIIGVTGSVASILTPKLVEAFLQKFNVCLIPTEKALNFYNLKQIQWHENLTYATDKDEWHFKEWTKESRVKHIDLRTWADAILIAPLGANTLGKIANGLCDNLLTSIVRAWDFAKPVFIAPSMNCLMYSNPITQRQLKILKVYDAKVIEPIVKKLACGDVGIGGLADIEYIFKVVDDEMTWQIPIKNCRGIPVKHHPGAFGYKRSYYYHTGVDLYCNDGDEVYAAERGEVVNIEDFTGPKLGHSWWEPTQSVLVRGKSGTVVYGEITPSVYSNIGNYVFKGQLIGTVKRVLPFGKERPDIAGHSLSMLHLELYKSHVKDSVSWHHGDVMPDCLFDPTEKLLAACPNVLEHPEKIY